MGFVVIINFVCERPGGGQSSKPDMVAYTFNRSTQEEKANGSEFSARLVQVSSSYIERPCLEKNK